VALRFRVYEIFEQDSKMGADFEDVDFESGDYNGFLMELPFSRIKDVIESSPSIAFSTDELGSTMLHEAAITGRADVVQMLLALKANPNAKDINGRTPLYKAAFYGHPEIIELLIANGADVNIVDSDGTTVLSRALHSRSGNSEELVKILLLHGAK
jgi:ankyrin repeat protein